MSRRTERLNKTIKREISWLLEREVNDPRLSTLVSVTRVSVSLDLMYAKVFVSILGNEENKTEVLAGFNAASGFLRRELSSRLRLRHVPQLSFRYDDSIERGASLLQIIQQVGDSHKPDA